MVYAHSKQDYDIALQALKTHNRHAAIYAQKIRPELYAAYAFPVPRFGHNTSNIVESLNGSWKDIRSMTPLHMLCSIWSKVMETVANRQNRQVKEVILCPAIKHLFDKRLATSRRYRVIPSSSTVFQVSNEEGKDYIVNLKKKTCSCAQFHEYGGPCSHAIQAAKAVQVDPYTLFRKEYLVSEYIQGYRRSIPPILFQDLVMNHIQPPLVTRRTGRPPTKRIRKRTALQDRTNQCSNIWCRERGHNKRGCQTVEFGGEIITRADETSTGVSSSEDEATRVSRIIKAKAVRKRGLIAKAQGTNLRKGRKRVVEISSDDDIELEGDGTTSSESGDEEGNATLDEIVVATREAHALGVKSRFQIAAEAVVARRKAAATQKATNEAIKTASLAVEAAKEAAEHVASDEFWGFTQTEKEKELELRPSPKSKRAKIARACTKHK
jgi:hypothetical protein